MAARIRIAAAQPTVGCDPAANGASVRALMRAAHDQGARLVHFPEGAVSGYPSGAEAKQALSGWRIDWSAVRDELTRVAALAAELRLWVVVGCSHRLAAPHRPHNSLYVVSDEGLPAGRYDKRLCSHTEITDWYSPGSDPLVFDVDGFRFGTVLCVEIHFPELFAEYRELEVDCVLLSSFSEDPVFGVMARAHAAGHSSWVSVSVPAQCSGPMPSGVSGPHGYWLGRCPSDGTEAVVCVDLDREDPALDVALNKARPWRVTARRARARGGPHRPEPLPLPHRSGRYGPVSASGHREGRRMRAIVVTDQTAGTAGMALAERPEPQPAGNDVLVEVHASGFTPGELDWPSTWTDRLGRDRTPSIPGHELAGVVRALGYGTTGLSVGQRVFGLTDWTRDGTLAEYAAVEARNLAPLPGDVDFTVGASLPISGLTAWQGLFEHGRVRPGQSVLVHGAAGGVGSMVTQLAREAGAYVIGTGRAADRDAALGFGAEEFLDLGTDTLEDAGPVDLVFDVIGGDIGKRSAALVRPGGTLVTIAGPPEARPADGLAIGFVVVSDRGQLNEIVQRVREGRLRPRIGSVAALDDAVAAFNPAGRAKGKTVVRVRPEAGDRPRQS